MNLDQAHQYIRHSFESGCPAQAYVIKAPPRESGHELVCQIFGIIFDARGAELACDGKHPDVHWIEPEKKSRVISVDSMRVMLKSMHETAFEGGWKVFVFVGADRMNAASANAFLKTLEEPPEKTLFLLLTDSPQALLPTIISRCQQVTLNDGNSDGLDDELRSAIAGVLAGGGHTVIGGIAVSERLVQVLKNVKSSIQDDETDLWYDEQLALGMDEKEIKKKDDALLARIESRYREIRKAVIRSVMLWYRDILLLVCNADPDLVVHREHLEQLQRQAQKTSYRNALQQVKKIEEVNDKLERNMPDILVFEDGFIG